MLLLPKDEPSHLIHLFQLCLLRFPSFSRDISFVPKEWFVCPAIRSTGPNQPCHSCLLDTTHTAALLGGRGQAIISCVLIILLTPEISLLFCLLLPPASPATVLFPLPQPQLPLSCSPSICGGSSFQKIRESQKEVCWKGPELVWG